MIGRIEDPIKEYRMSEFHQLEPFDEHNRQLQANVHPADWQNPIPSGRYNLVVIGAGTAGLVTAAGAAGLGARVALVEQSLMGGDCLNVGCVPSKAIISSARAARRLRESNQFGVRPNVSAAADFGATMQRMRRLRASISINDSAARFRDLGVDVFLGQGRFLNSNTVDVDGTHLPFKRAVVATGARAAAPPIDGLDAVTYLTNETLFSLTELPGKLAVIGGGPIGCEMAQAFAQLGSDVYLIETADSILPNEDPDAASIVHRSMLDDDVTVWTRSENTRIASGEANRIAIKLQSAEQHELEVDQLLLAVGRAPNIEGLDLEKAGVEFDRHGLQVDDFLRTTNRNIFAAGDICSPYQFTHAADFMARIVIQNALFPGLGPFGKARFSRLTIPWCTYTSPEVAHIGLYPREARDKHIPIDTFTHGFDEVDRAILEGDENGFARVHVKKGSDQIVGATIVARNAGDLISEISLAMTNKLGLRQIASTIHPYPTQADAIRRIGDQYNRTRLSPRVASILKKWMSWTR